MLIDCLSNYKSSVTPMESFLVHFIDLAEYISLDNFKDAKKEVDRVIQEYNHHRYQWGLNKMTPVQYRATY